jgi:hypothetical protein
LAVIILLFILKKMKSISRTLEYLYEKVNPYALSYLYRFVVLDQFFSVIIFLSYTKITDTLLGILSLVMLFVDAGILGLTFFWKIKPS